LAFAFVTGPSVGRELVCDVEFELRFGGEMLVTFDGITGFVFVSLLAK